MDRVRFMGLIVGAVDDAFGSLNEGFRHLEHLGLIGRGVNGWMREVDHATVGFGRGVHLLR